MKCDQTPEMVAAWLDGEVDLGPHALECTECQQQLAQLQKLRSRLQPPPCPLGADFARTTAARVVRDSVLQSRVDFQRQLAGGHWLRRVLDNPLVHVVSRERSRRMLALPKLLALLALYLVPAVAVTEFGGEDARWAFFGTLRIALLALVPLYLLILEYVTVASLVRGRCLEEILHAGVEPELVCDTVAANGLRSLLPTSLLISLTLLILQPGPDLFGWLIVSWLAYASTSYVSLAQLFGGGRSLSMLYLAFAACALAAPQPWNWLCAPFMVVSAWLHRRRAILQLRDLQAGRTPPRVRPASSAWHRALRRRLPDDALLQRELIRHPNLPLTPWVLALTAAAGGVTWLEPRWFLSPGLFGLALSLMALLLSTGVVTREKQTGAFEVLMHSGLQSSDWLRSAFRLTSLTLWPFMLGGSLCLAWVQAGEAFAPALALGWLLLAVVSCWVGAVLGCATALQTERGNAMGEALKQWLLALVYAGIFAMLGNLVLGPVSPLVQMIGFQSHAFVGAVLWVLALMGAVSRTRGVEADLLKDRRTPIGLWITGTQLVLPLALAYQFTDLDLSVSKAGSWFGALSGFWVAVLCWCWSPVQGFLFGHLQTGKQRLRLFGAACLTSAAAVALTFWSSWALVLLAGQTDLLNVLEDWNQVRYDQLTLIMIPVFALWMALGLRNRWGLSHQGEVKKAVLRTGGLGLAVVALGFPLASEVHQISELANRPLPKLTSDSATGSEMDAELHKKYLHLGVYYSRRRYVRGYTMTDDSDYRGVQLFVQERPELVTRIRRALQNGEQFSLDGLNFSAAILRADFRAQLGRNSDAVAADLKGLATLATQMREVQQWDESPEAVSEYLGLLLLALSHHSVSEQEMEALLARVAPLTRSITEDEITARQICWNFRGASLLSGQPSQRGDLYVRYLKAELQRALAAAPDYRRYELQSNWSAWERGSLSTRALSFIAERRRVQLRDARILGYAIEAVASLERYRYAHGRYPVSFVRAHSPLVETQYVVKPGGLSYTLRLHFYRDRRQRLLAPRAGSVLTLDSGGDYITTVW